MAFHWVQFTIWSTSIGHGLKSRSCFSPCRYGSGGDHAYWRSESYWPRLWEIGPEVASSWCINSEIPLPPLWIDNVILLSNEFFSLLALNGLVKDDWFYGHFLKPSRANDLLSCFHYLQVVPSTNPPRSELLVVKKSHLLCHMGCQVQRILWGCSSIIQGWGCIRIWDFSSHFFIHSSEPDQQHSIISQKTSIVSLVSLTSSSQPSSCLLQIVEDKSFSSNPINQVSFKL